MRSLHYFHVRAQPHNPTGKENAGELGLGMTRWHVDNQALALAFGDSFELFGEELVVLAFDEAVPDLLDIVDEVFLGFAAGI